MEKQISKNWYLTLIKGVIMTLLAVLLFTSPADSLFAYVLYIGIGFIIAGIAIIVQGIAAKGILDNWGWIVFGGVMDIFLGFILIAHPALTVSIIPIMIGFWAAFYGIFLIIDAFSGTGGTVLKIIFGILILIMANTIIFNPVSFGLTLAIWLGVILLFAGIYNIINSFSLK
ncbi:MAG: DUF308 domain-containing protein [Bacteroidota bacterium]